MDADTHLPSDDVPTDAFERRLPAENPYQRWLFFDANRWLVVAPIMVLVLAVHVALAWANVLDYRDTSTVTLLMSAYIAGNFTLVTIVITVNQLVLSREFGKPHTLRARNEGIQEFRNDVEDAAGRSVSPADPEGFLRVIALALRDHGDRLRELAPGVRDPELADEFETYTSAVREEAERLIADLDDVEFGDFDILISLLFYRIAWQLQSTRRFRDAHGESLPKAAVELLDDTQTLLRLLNIARQYLQTLYMQRELARLSRLLLYVGLPALLVSTVTMLVYPANPGQLDRPALLQALVVVASSVAYAPLAILLAFVVRISTIVSRMAVLSPFISNG